MKNINYIHIEFIILFCLKKKLRTAFDYYILPSSQQSLRQNGMQSADWINIVY